MSKRSKARQVAVQMLFQHDLNPDVDAKIVKEMIADRLNDKPIRELSWRLYCGVTENRDGIDEKIQSISSNWSVSRMPNTDRAVMRLGVFELLMSDTPAAVAINEAIELAKKFGSSQSSQFVNAILDRLVPAEKRPPGRPVPSGPVAAPEYSEDPNELPEGAVLDRLLPKGEPDLE